MGWLYTHKPESQSTKAFLITRVNCDNDIATHTVLDCAIVNFRTAYFAVRYFNKQTQQERVYGLVFRLNYCKTDYYNVGYKDMDETVGPHCYSAPERILKLLTPTDNRYANEWRTRCWQRIAQHRDLPPLKAGTIIRHKTQPLAFMDGKKRRYFRILKRGCYQSLTDRVLCRISKNTLREMEVCSKPPKRQLQLILL